MHHAIHPDTQARAKVPILELRRWIDNSIVIQLVESDVITRFVASNWSEQGTQLVPPDSIREAKMNLFVHTFMDQLASSIFTFPSTKSATAANKEFQQLCRGLLTVDRAITLHGEQCENSGAYFLGDEYSLAETLTTPFVARMIPIFKYHRGVDVLELSNHLGAFSVKKWMEAVCVRPSLLASLPNVKSLLPIPPYMQPFFKYKIPELFQNETVLDMLKDKDLAAIEEHAFQQRLKDGSVIAGYEKGTLKKIKHGDDNRSRL